MRLSAPLILRHGAFRAAVQNPEEAVLEHGNKMECMVVRLADDSHVQRSCHPPAKPRLPRPQESDLRVASRAASRPPTVSTGAFRLPDAPPVLRVSLATRDSTSRDT